MFLPHSIYVLQTFVFIDIIYVNQYIKCINFRSSLVGKIADIVRQLTNFHEFKKSLL